MLPYDRQQQILKILETSGHVNIHKLALAIHVSEPTLRRDLTRMEELGLIRRTYGGAVLQDHSQEAPLIIRREDNTIAKKKIAAQAVQLIHKGSVVFLDSSSTVQTMINFLSVKQEIVVVTNCISACQRLADLHIKTYCVGGLVDGGDDATRGKYALDFIRQMHIDQAFFSCSSLSENGLLGGSNEHGVAFLQTLLHHSAQRIFLCSYNKLNQTRMHTVCSLQDVDTIICDQELPPHLHKMVGKNR